MTTDTEIVFTPAGDRSDMIVVFTKQLNETRELFEKHNATEFISLKSAAKTNHMRSDYASNLEMLVKYDFFVLTPDKEAVDAILREYQELSLDHAKLEVRPKKVKPEGEDEDAAEGNTTA